MKHKTATGILAVVAIGAGVLLYSFRWFIWVYADLWRTERAMPSAVTGRQRKRAAVLIAFARAHSAYYRTLYRGLPDIIGEIATLPVVTKPGLMAHFDQWVTDMQVTRASVEAFVTNPGLIGRRYLVRYSAWTTSGTTGRPGIFLHDRRAMSIYAALIPSRGYQWVTPALLWHLLWRGRIAVLVATEGHFAIADWFKTIQHRVALFPGLRERIQIYSATKPIATLAHSLNDFQPSMLLGYPSIMKLLAIEQNAGRLHIMPKYVGAGGEELDSRTRWQIEEAFHCILRDNYGASEFPYAAFECAYGWLHSNADWLLLEPVDAAYQPVPPGQPSNSVLLTNLANHIQPLIRYDLGDSITVRPDPCPCGSPLPAVYVEGRAGDILHMQTPSHDTIAVLPLAIGTIVDETPGIVLAQVIQTGESTLTLRLESAQGAGSSAPTELWQHVEQRLRDYLASLGILSVTIVRSPEAPQQDPISGKFRQVWSAIHTP